MSLAPLLRHARVIERRAPLEEDELAALGPLPEETQRFADKRRDEFLRGRHAARLVLAELGVEVGLLPIGADRAAVWPEGTVGAITHCTGFAAAAAGPRALLRGVGIDAQPIAEERSLAALRRTSTPEEIARLGDRPELTARTLVFAAKEALYKALAPTVGSYFGFEAARVEAATNETCTLRLTRTLHAELVAHRTFLVRWSVADGLAFAAVEW